MTLSKPDEIETMISSHPEFSTIIRVASSLRFQQSKLNDVVARFEAHGDPLVALALGALIDDILVEFFKARLNQETINGKYSLLQAFGPLSSFNLRARMAFALDWIPKATFQDIDVVRRIRNVFAHNIEVEDLGHAKVRGLLINLRPSERKLWVLEDVGDWLNDHPLSNRELLVIRCCFLVIDLVQNLLGNTILSLSTAGAYDSWPTPVLKLVAETLKNHTNITKLAINAIIGTVKRSLQNLPSLDGEPQYFGTGIYEVNEFLRVEVDSPTFLDIDAGGLHYRLRSGAHLTVSNDFLATTPFLNVARVLAKFDLPQIAKNSASSEMVMIDKSEVSVFKRPGTDPIQGTVE